MLDRRGNCDCHRCRRLPRPRVIGDQHAVAVVLHLNADAAHVVASAFPYPDRAGTEIIEAVTAWEDARDA